MALPWLESVARAGGRTGAMLRATDWSRTPLGPVDAWPAALRDVVGTCLVSRFPLAVAWGPRLTLVYNDAYARVLGPRKHPAAFGAPFLDVWAEIGPDLAPLVGGVLEGRPSWSADQPLLLDRAGYLEETTFTYSFSPVRDDDGAVGGVLAVVHETTEQVVARRRIGAAGALAHAVADPPRDVHALAQVVIDQLARTHDIATAALHVRDGDTLRLVGAMPEAVPAAVGALLVDTVASSGVVVELGTCLVLPLPDPRERRPAGVLVLAGNPRRPWDEEQRAFLRLLGATVGTALRRTLEVAREVDALRLVADALQAAMLPEAVDLPWLQTRYRPADGELAVGGDWYDVVDVGEDRLALLVGDCVGHGLEAAALMGQLRSAGRALLLEGNGPADVVRTLDRVARRLPGAECTTVFCAVVDPATGEVRHTAAGHVPPLLVGPGGTHYLEGGRSTPLAVGGVPRQEAVTALGPDDTLLLYTDGLVERRGESLRVGLRRLADLSRTLLPAPLDAVLVDRLLAGMLPDGQSDDVAVVLCRRPPGPGCR